MLLQWIKSEFVSKLSLFGLIIGFMPIACAMIGNIVAAGAFLCVLLLLRVVEILYSALRLKAQVNELLAKALLQTKQTEAVYASMLSLQAMEVVNARKYATSLMDTMKNLYSDMGQLVLNRGQFPEEDDDDVLIENFSQPAKLH